MLGKGLLVLERGELRVGRRVHRQDVGVLLVERRGVAVHREAVAPEEDVKLLLLRLVHVRLVHDDERVHDVHRGALEVLAEEHLDHARGVGDAVRLLGVGARLGAQLGLVGATEDVDRVDDAVVKHQADELLEGARLARLAHCDQHRVAEGRGRKDGKDVVRGAHLLGEGHCLFGVMSFIATTVFIPKNWLFINFFHKLIK